MRQIPVFFSLVALALLTLLTSNSLSAQSGTTVFINEIHYDNTSTDAGEAIEIAGPAGTDLTGWSIVLYNGSGGAVYDTDNLSGLLPDQGNGFGTAVISYPVNGIQNGAPDGIALVNNGGAVVQFLSYEGTFTAVGGAANGLVSTDIGVSQAGTEAIGSSLQLTGSGTTYEDFTWSSTSVNTFGAVNTGQTFTGNGGGDPTPTDPPPPPPPPPAAALVINEVDYDQASTDTAEFLEIKNSSGGSVNLDSYSVSLINGSGGAIYATFDLPNVELAADAYFVICADANVTPNCDLDATPDSNLIQNGAPDAIAILLNGAIVDALSYEGNTVGFTEGSGSTGDNDLANTGLSRLPDGADTDNNSADFSVRCITPGAANTSDTANCPAPGDGGGGDPPIGQCFDGNTTLISAIQGAGALSPLVGQTVVIEGIVTGDFQDLVGTNGDLNGFYVQEEDAQSDGNPLTSEGIFVFQGSNPAVDVRVGDVVRVLGGVVEFATSSGASNLTELSNVASVLVCGTASLPTPTDVTLPVSAVSDFERYEGMLVRFPQPLVISEYFNFDRFNEMVLAQPLAGEDRLHQPTAIEEPGSPEAAARASYNARSQITLDDGRSTQNTVPTIHPNGGVFTFTNTFRGGDLVTNAVGVIDDSFGLYRIQPTAGAEYTAVNPRTTAPDAVGGQVKVASFNVLNLFNGDGLGGGFPTSRGATTLSDYQRQLTKIVAAILALDADVVGLLEIENDPTSEQSSLDDLVDALNAQAGAGSYEYIATGAIGTDEITVAIIYQPATVTPAGSVAVLDDQAFVNPFGAELDRNRPAVAQTFDENGTGERFTVVVNHLKSKGSACGSGDDDPQQGNCNATRAAAAAVLVDWLAGDPTMSYDPDFMIMGDLNAYDKEDPIDVISAGADDATGTGDDFTDLAALYGGEFAYSYLFSGQLGYLDYALANQALTPQTTGATEWHINADEPDLWDYSSQFNAPGFYEANQFRASDHDPVLVGVDLAAPIININADLALVETTTSVTFTPQPNAPKGLFTISATFQNISQAGLRQIFFQVAQLTNGNLLLNADGGPAGAGAQLSVAGSALGADTTLTPGETFTVEFKIGLARRSPFIFLVDALGASSISGINGAAVPGSSILFEMDVDGVGGVMNNQVFLPFVNSQQ